MDSFLNAVLLAEYPIFVFILIALIHWIADFVAQSHWMASNKSKNNRALSIHIGAYTALLLIVFGPIYALVNGLAHWLTDYVTSRVTSKLHGEGKIHDFFVVIGLDQYLHYAVLFMTVPLIWWL